jgi:hypothetical protein
VEDGAGVRVAAITFRNIPAPFTISFRKSKRRRC